MQQRRLRRQGPHRPPLWAPAAKLAALAERERERMREQKEQAQQPKGVLRRSERR
jgi:hypothetical protein